MSASVSRGLRVRATALPAASEPAALPARPPAVAVGRRRALGGAASVALASALAAAQPALAAASAKAPPGFTLFTDATKGYAFAYPVGWGDVTLEGQDKAFRDVIQPLESASLSVSPTARQSLAEAGTPDEVAAALLAKSAAPGTKTELLKATSRVDAAGVPYYAFEFLSSARGATRHSITTLGVTNGKVFTLTTGCEQKRWPKMEERLRQVVDSFVLLGY